MLLDEYVYLNVEKYGNCALTERLVKRTGKKNIINELKKYGLDCKITNHEYLNCNLMECTYEPKKFYIVERVKE